LVIGAFAFQNGYCLTPVFPYASRKALLEKNRENSDFDITVTQGLILDVTESLGLQALNIREAQLLCS
jgi:hypothetical protein